MSCIAAVLASVALVACTQEDPRTREQIATTHLGEARAMFLKDGVEAESRARAASVARFATADDCYSLGTDRALAWDRLQTYADLEVCLLRGARDVAEGEGGFEAVDAWLRGMGFDVRASNFGEPDRVLVEHRAHLKVAAGQTPSAEDFAEARAEIIASGEAMPRITAGIQTDDLRARHPDFAPASAGPGFLRPYAMKAILVFDPDGGQPRIVLIQHSAS